MRFRKLAVCIIAIAARLEFTECFVGGGRPRPKYAPAWRPTGTSAPRAQIVFGGSDRRRAGACGTVGGTPVPAKASLRALYDPKAERMRG